MHRRRTCTTKQKLVAPLDQLSHGASAAFLTSELRMSELLIHKRRQSFVLDVCKVFESKIVRRPTLNDIKNIMKWHTLKLVSMVLLEVFTVLDGSHIKAQSQINVKRSERTDCESFAWIALPMIDCRSGTWCLVTHVP